MGTFRVQSYGCRASQADGAALEALLSHDGWDAAGNGTAELVVLNSCTVTATADADLRQTIRRVHQESPAARIVVTGCYAQRAPNELAEMPGVALVVGNSHKPRLAELVRPGLPYHGGIQVGDISAQQEFLSSPVEDAGADRTRPNLKIQDGCGNRCSFCVIPSVRGRSRSMPEKQVVEQVRSLADRYREVVLSGVNLGRWGREPGSQMRLVDLLRVLLADTDVERLRISSVEPMDLSDELLALMAYSGRIAAHVHAPLQSGCDSVLRRMRRKYRTRHYEERVRRARALMPDAALGADVMAGFPGETLEEFEESYRFIESVDFTYLHVFTYSERPGTAAAAWPQVENGERKRRTRLLRELGETKNREFRARMVGKVLPAVTLQQGGLALTSNFLTVELARVRQPNQLLDVRVGGLTPRGVSEAGVLTILPISQAEPVAGCTP